MISLAEVFRRSEQAGDKLPLLTLAEFFDGNSEEDSLAPNQWGYGRPPLAEIHRRLVALEAAADVAWIRVELHYDTFDGGGISAESVAICTTATSDELEQRLGTSELESDGVMQGLSYDEDEFCDMPLVPPGYQLLSLVWD